MMTDSCNSDTLISIHRALAKISEQLAILQGEETINLQSALGRILTQDCIAPFNLPAFPNSSMDGYAFNSADKEKTDFNLIQVGTSWAGSPFSDQLLDGQCVRIFTGAVIPDGADSVIMQEHTTYHDKSIHFPKNTPVKQNIRYTGEDVKQYDCLLAAPKQLTAIDLGLLASAGLYEIKVKRKIRIAFFSTGDELRAIGTPLAAGQIYDSNRYSLNALLTHPCHSVTDLGVITDDKERIRQCLLSAAQSHDVIISTGGASVGDADYIHEVLVEIGQVNFWKLAMKPGKPVAFGRIQDCIFFGLPGNPMSVIATYEHIVAPALRQLIGLGNSVRLRFKATSKSPLRKQPGRLEFQRGILSQTETGEFEVISSGKQGSNILSASSRANCYIILAAEQTQIDVGEQVIVEPFSLFL